MMQTPHYCNGSCRALGKYRGAQNGFEKSFFMSQYMALFFRGGSIGVAPVFYTSTGPP